jgi:hypothetical protein
MGRYPTFNRTQYRGTSVPGGTMSGLVALDKYAAAFMALSRDRSLPVGFRTATRTQALPWP